MISIYKIAFLFCKRTALVFAGLFVLLSQLSFAQRKFSKGSDIFGTRVFVENKGQFDKAIPGSEKVFFAYESSDERMYFTQSGPVYNLVERSEFTERMRERAEKGKKVKIKPEVAHYVRVRWLNANPAPAIVESEKQNHYFTYGGSEFNSSTFKKITYKNVYDKIDIEYVLPKDKEHGIKYSIILHPGADPSKIRISYEGEVKKVSLKNGEVVVRTSRENIIEHLPLTFYEEGGTKINCNYLVENKVISFRLDPITDPEKTVVIDPWVTTITGMPSGNLAYDVDHDGTGNTFIYGGLNQVKVSKYDIVGNLLWTFSGVVGGISWTAQGPGNPYIGNFAVNRNTGKTYLGQGYVVNNDGRIIRLDAAGNYDNWVTPPLYTVEVWDMIYHCPSGRMFELGGSTILNLSGGLIDQQTATVQVANFTGFGSTGQDVLSTTIDDAGNIFAIYASLGTPSTNNRILRVNNTFNGNIWMVPSTFTTFGEAYNKDDYMGGGYQGNGFNCLAVNDNYLFYYDGYNIAAYNKNTGAMLGNSTIPMLMPRVQGGIAVDECNNVYFGGIDNLFCYYFNGSSFIPLPSLQLNAPSVSKFVYDIKLDRATKQLYVCGSGFVGVYNAIHSNTCSAAGVSLTLSCNGLNNASALATVTVAIANPTISYIWSNISGTVSTTMNTNAMNNGVTLANGTYTLQTIVNPPCGPVFINTLNVQCCPTVAITSTVTQAGCSYAVNSATVSVAGIGTVVPTASWSPAPQSVGPNSLTATGLIPGVTTVSINLGFGCTNVTTLTALAQAPPVTFTLNNTGPNASITCTYPFVNLAAVSNYTFGSLSYSWTSISFTAGTPSVSISAPNILTVTVMDPLSGCFMTKTVAITMNTVAPTNSVNPTSQFITCNSGAPATFSGTVISPTVNVQHDWYSPLNPLPNGVPIATSNNTISILSGGVPPGIYTLQTTDLVNGCKSIKTVTVGSLDAWPTFSINSPTNFSVGCAPLNQTTISIINPVSTQTPPATCSYTFLPPSFVGLPTPSVILGGNTSTVTTIPGTWTVIVQDNSNWCRTILSVPIIQNTVAPNVSASMLTQTLTCKNPTVIGTGTTTTPHTTITWNVPSTPPSLSTPTLVIGDPANGPNTSTNSLTYANFTVVATNSLNACQSTSVVTINQNFKPPVSSPTISIATPTAIYCTVANVPVVLTTGNSTTTSGGLNAFVANPCWEGPSPQTPTCGPSSYSCYVPGIYSLTLEDSYNGCKHTGTVNVLDRSQPPVLTNEISSAVLDCGSEQAVLPIAITGPSTGLKYWYYQYPQGASFNPTNAITPNGGNLHLSGTSVSSVSVSLAGRYYYYVTNTLTGCRSSGVFDVVKGGMEFSITSDVESGTAPLTVVLSPSNSNGLNNVSLVWSFGNGSVSTSSTNIAQTAIYHSPGTYTVMLISVKGQCKDTSYKMIRVEQPSKLEQPNIFTPNGDGNNDVYFLRTAAMDEIRVSIFDRWGNIVYQVESSTGNIEWNGKNSKGQEASSGIYFYVLKAKGKDGKEYSEKGNITLLR